jgi:hypothetical protein
MFLRLSTLFWRLMYCVQVLEIGEIKLEKRWLCSAKDSSVWVHRTVRWCTGQCPVRQAGVSQLAALGKQLTVYDYKSPDCPVSQQSVQPTVGRIIRARHVARANGQKGHRTVRCAPDSVWCANGSEPPTVGFAKEGKKSAPDSARCARRQKARIAFLKCSQRLLAALGL